MNFKYPPAKSANLAPVVVPLDQLVIDADLNGQSGSNRATSGRPQIAANDDLSAIRVWLARFADTPTTFNNYRKEAERLLLWALIERRRPLSSLTHEDLLIYQRFLDDPQPKARWVLASGRKPSRDHPLWRPFAGPLSATSQRQAMVILNALFSWLVNAGYLAGNPLALSRQRARKAKPRVTRFLDEELWQEVKTAIDVMPRDTKRERAHYHRVRWLFSLLYLCALRISEVIGNSMGNFFSRRDREGEDRWWLEIVGKGEKTRLVPATDELMVELMRYRRECGLAPLPSSGESTPLLLPIGGRHQPMTRSAVHLIVKTVIEHAATRLQAKGDDFTFRANLLRQASAHWLRHTAGSRMTDSEIDLRHVRDNLGHESLTTTSAYLHSEDDLRHRETERRHRLNW